VSRPYREYIPTNTNRDQVRPQRGTDFRWFWLFTTAAVTAIVIAFGRFRSNERIALAIAAGVARRRSEPEAASPE
jgi:hypothetical protein